MRDSIPFTGTIPGNHSARHTGAAVTVAFACFTIFAVKRF